MRSLFLFEETYDAKTDTWKKENHTLKKKKNSKVTVSMFRHFIQNCIRWAAEYLNWPIGFPNEIIDDNEK